MTVMEADFMQYKQNKFISFIVNIGEWVTHLFLLHFFALIYLFKGFVLFGFFPSLAVVFESLMKTFQDPESTQSVSKHFQSRWNVYFKKANCLGYVLLSWLIFLYIDLRINRLFIQSVVLDNLLIMLFLVSIFVTMYTFPLLVTFDLGFFALIKQSFFIALSVPLFTLAAIIGGFLAFELLSYFRFLIVFFGMPLFILPLSWFTYTGFEKAIERRNKLSEEEA